MLHWIPVLLASNRSASKILALASFAARLCRDRAGNAILLVALGLPAMIGGAGLAVDTAQWYMWKRELQFAADQAAIAGAWSRAKAASGTGYQERARQELLANESIVDFATEPDVALADFAGGDDNSVVVTVQATRSLPFSSFLTGRAATIAVRAQASFSPGRSYTSCLLAVDDDEEGAITIGGNATLTAGCGMAALSRAETAIRVNGSPQIQAGWLIAAGGIDDWLNDNTDDVILENVEGLFDPFAELTPPTNPAPRTYACSKGATTTTADVLTTVATSYSYRKGSTQNNAVAYVYASPRLPAVSSTSQVGVPVASGTVAGTATTAASQWIRLTGSGQNTIWEVKTSTTTTAYANVTVTTTSDGAYMLPGTYASFETRCNTTMASGVYVIDGGMFTVRSQDVLVGSGVLIVFRNGAGININGGANVTLTAMSASQLMSAGQSATNANKLASMLVFEDRDSPGTNRNMINGNARTVLNGTIYLPRSNLTFAGTATVTSQCLMIAASTITIQGTADMSTFCPPGLDLDTVVAVTSNSVRLVS